MTGKYLESRIITNGDKYLVERLMEKRILFWTYTEWVSHDLAWTYDTLEEAEKELARINSLHEWRPV